VRGDLDSVMRGATAVQDDAVTDVDGRVWMLVVISCKGEIKESVSGRRIALVTTLLGIPY
jgi:hypothetical protein